MISRTGVCISRAFLCFSLLFNNLLFLFLNGINCIWFGTSELDRPIYHHRQQKVINNTDKCNALCTTVDGSVKLLGHIPLCWSYNFSIGMPHFEIFNFLEEAACTHNGV